MIRRGIRDMQCENADYHTTINRVLATVHMNKNRTACLYTTGTRRAERQGHYRLLRPSRRAHRSQPYQGCGAANGSSTNATCQYFICVALVDAYRAGGMPIDYRWQDYIWNSVNTQQNTQQHQLGAHTYPQEAGTCHERRPKRSVDENFLAYTLWKNIPCLIV